MILSIDQSLTETGVCYLSSDGRIQTFIIKSSPNQGWGERLSSIVNRLNSILDLSALSIESPSEVEYVIMEGYALAGSFRPFQLGELGGCLKYNFYLAGYNVMQIPIQQHKMFTARNGKATKQEIIASLKDRFGIDTPNNNAADAVSMALLFNAKLNKDKGESFERYDLNIIERMEKSISGEGLTAKPKKQSRRRPSGESDPSFDKFAF